MRGSTWLQSHSTPEEIDQIGRLCLCKTQTFASPGPGCITQGSNTGYNNNCRDVSTDITPACKFICSSPLLVVKILENLQLKHCQPRVSSELELCAAACFITNNHHSDLALGAQHYLTSTQSQLLPDAAPDLTLITLRCSVDFGLTN